MSTIDDVTSLSYERALAELDALIERLEGGAVNLEEAIACYERGSRLVQRCSELLDRTEQSVMQLVVGGGGSLQERPFTPASTAEPPPGQPDPMPAPPPEAQRARPVGGRRAPSLLPGLDAEPASERRPPIDPDEIPF